MTVEEPDFTEEYLDGFTTWIKEVKGIYEIDLIEMVDMVPEYEEWKQNNN